MDELIRENNELKRELKELKGQMMVKDEVLSQYRINRDIVNKEMEKELQKMEFRCTELEIANKRANSGNPSEAAGRPGNHSGSPTAEQREIQKLAMEIRVLKEEKEELELEVASLKYGTMQINEQ